LEKDMNKIEFGCTGCKLYRSIKKQSIDGKIPKCLEDMMKFELPENICPCVECIVQVNCGELCDVWFEFANRMNVFRNRIDHNKE
jgi:hypothetical protein